MSKIFYIITVLLLFTFKFSFSQEWKKGGEIIDFPKYEKVKGVKKITVYYTKNNKDTVVSAEEIYSKNGNRLSFVKYDVDNGDTLLFYDYLYVKDRLVEIRSAIGGTKYYYTGDKVVKLIKWWNYFQDTLIHKYSYSNNNIIKLTSFSNSPKRRVTVSPILYNYNELNQLLSCSSENGVYLKFNYDDKGNLINEIQGGKIDKSYKYDNSNNLIEFKNYDNIPLPKVRNYKYDKENHLICLTEYNEKEKLTKTINYIYGKNERKILFFYKRIKKNPDETLIEKYNYW